MAGVLAYPGFSSSDLAWLVPLVILICAALVPLVRRRPLLTQNLCLLPALIAALSIVALKSSKAAPADHAALAHGATLVCTLPAFIFGAALKLHLSAGSLTLRIFILLAFLFSLAWAIATRPTWQRLFWLVMAFALQWSLAEAANLMTVFVFAQLLLLPQFFLNLGAAATHARRVARRLLISAVLANTFILVAATMAANARLAPLRALPGGDPSSTIAEFIFLTVAVWLSLPLFPAHNAHQARVTLDAQNMLPANSSLWVGLALMLQLTSGPLAPVLHRAAPLLAVFTLVAIGACSVASFAQRELTRSMAYAASAVTAFAFLTWLSQSVLGIAAAFLILGTLQITVFGFQRGIDLLFLLSPPPPKAANIGAREAMSAGPNSILFLLLTAACIGMPATAIFTGVWLGIIGMIAGPLPAYPHTEYFISPAFGIGAVFVLMPMILGIISRSLLAFRDPAENIKRPDLFLNSVLPIPSNSNQPVASQAIRGYITAARRWAFLAILVSLTLGLFPSLALGPLIKSLEPAKAANPWRMHRSPMPAIPSIPRVIVENFTPRQWLPRLVKLRRTYAAARGLRANTALKSAAADLCLSVDHLCSLDSWRANGAGSAGRAGDSGHSSDAWLLGDPGGGVI